MKKQMMKVGLVAALVMGAMSAANAASVADLTFTGAVTKATCDVNVAGGNTQTINLGKYAAAEFVAVGTPLNKSSKQVTLSFSSCVGEQIAAGESLVLSVSQQSSVSPVLSNAGLWGDNPIGVGVRLTAESQDPDLIPVDALTPDENEMEIFTADDVASPAADAAPQPVVLTAALASYLPSASITSGTIKAPLEFSVSYD